MTAVSNLRRRHSTHAEQVSTGACVSLLQVTKSHVLKDKCERDVTGDALVGELVTCEEVICNACEMKDEK